MPKLPTLVLAVLLAPACLVAAIVCALGPNAAAYRSSDDQRPSSDAMQVGFRVSAAMKAICADHCPQVGVFRNPSAAKAMLVLDPPDARFVYSPPFFADVYSAYGDAGVAAIFAHALGHALDDTMGAAWVNPKWNPELRADAWGGCILGRMALKDAEMAAALNALAKHPAPSHPAWNQRLAPLRAGFTHCGGTAAAFDKKR
jgi:hypothetical protein